MNDKEWKEKTKLNNKNKAMITLYIIMIIFSITVGIIEKDATWIICSLLWGNLVIKEYCDAKLLKGKDVLYDLQEDLIENKTKIINHLVKEIDMLRNIRIIELNKIKIPKYFTKPNKKKMEKRTEYFKEYKQFAVPIVIDKNNKLVDGYTTYLVAKQKNFSHVEVRIV